MGKAPAARVFGEEIYSTLKDDILNAELQPGAILDEMQLMERFAVSRTPVREVIRKLVGRHGTPQEHLCKSIHGAGYRRFLRSVPTDAMTGHDIECSQNQQESTW